MNAVSRPLNALLQYRSPLFQISKRYARTRPAIHRKPLSAPPIKKRLDIVIMGTPNVGKSVLLNTMIKHKVAATSRKRHTTRGEILGVFNHRNTQLLFYDTPGYLGKTEKKSRLQVLRELADSSVEKADVVLLVVDASRHITDNYRFVFAEMVRMALRHVKKELILVLNKVDLVDPKTKLLEITHELVSLINGVKLKPEDAHLAQLDTTTFMVSALHNDGLLDIKNYLIRSADVKPWLVKKGDGHTTLSPEEVVQEILLEAMLNNTHDEIPYVANIVCTSIAPLPEDANVLRVDVDIYLETGRQVRIVVGEKARTLLKLRSDATEQLEKIYKNRKVLVFLWVKANGGRGE